MWFLKSWIYKYRYGSLPFKMRNFTESFQSECREAIKEKFQKITAKLEDKWVRIKLKDAKNNMHSYWTDLLGKRHKVEQPIFTENEVKRVSQYMWAYPILLLIFIAFETFFYSYFGNLLLPKTTRNFVTVLIVGLSLAALFAVALHFAFKWIFEYFEVKYHIEKHNLEKKELKPFRTNLILGVFFCILFVIVNLAVGFIRADLLDPVANSQNTDLSEKIHMPWRLFAVLSTFLVAFVMAAVEKEIGSKSERWNVFKNWKKQQKERKLYNNAVKNMLKKCQEEKELLIEKYWGIIKDLQRVFQIEVDEDQQSLYQQLQEETIADGSFLENLDNVKYQKYLPIAATKLELFRYGIDSDDKIQEIIENLTDKVNQIEEFEESIAHLDIKKPSKSSNGNALNDNEFLKTESDVVI